MFSRRIIPTPNSTHSFVHLFAVVLSFFFFSWMTYKVIKPSNYVEGKRQEASVCVEPTVYTMVKKKLTKNGSYPYTIRGKNGDIF